MHQNRPELSKKNTILWHPPQIYIRFSDVGETGTYAFVKDPSTGDSESPDLDVGIGLMMGSWKDSRPVYGYLNFIVVSLITGKDCRGIFGVFLHNLSECIKNGGKT